MKTKENLISYLKKVAVHDEVILRNKKLTQAHDLLIEYIEDMEPDAVFFQLLEELLEDDWELDHWVYSAFSGYAHNHSHQTPSVFILEWIHEHREAEQRGTDDSDE